MRKSFIALLVLSTIGLFGPRAARASVNVSVSFFYDELSPYGRWSDVGAYGTCWIPSGVEAGWQPYTDGEWMYTDYGWTWISYDRWGGDTYHYGTWAWEPPFGWVWVPGTVWAPAWVTWSYSNSYIGWAPIPPTLSISFGGYAGPPLVVSQTHYVFVPVNRFAGVRVSSVRLPVQQNATYLRTGRNLTSFSVSRGMIVNRGPSVRQIERVSHSRIERRNIDVAKARPTPIAAAGARGRKFSVVAPAPVRNRELKARMASGGGAASPSGEARGSHAGPAGARRETQPEKGGSVDKKHAQAVRPSPPGPARREGTGRHGSPGAKKGEAAAPIRESPPPPQVREQRRPVREAPAPRSPEGRGPSPRLREEGGQGRTAAPPPPPAAAERRGGSHAAPGRAPDGKHLEKPTKKEDDRPPHAHD